MSSTIHDYLKELSKNLSDLPKEEKEAILEEIEMHLNENEATSKMLREFKTPYSLSQDYLQEYDYKDQRKIPNASFFLLNLGMMGLAMLVLPILDARFDSSSLARISLGVPMLLCGIITLFFIKRKDYHISKFIKAAPYFLLSLFFPVSLLFFWIAANQNDGIVMFSLYYMLIYWLLLVVYYVIIRIGSRNL
ncbi:HAAS signaling domain-containing protein [Oceanobacillus jeddahense]